MINDQNRSKVFLVIIGILLLANISMLAFFLQKRAVDKPVSRPDRKAYIANFLKDEIGFNEQQLAQYDTLSNTHRTKIKALYETAKNNKNDQFKRVVAGNFADSAINQAARQSAESQKIMEEHNFNHIKTIRLLCTADQLPRFDSLFVKVFNRKGEGRKKNSN